MAFTVAKAFDLISVAHERGRLAHAFLVTGAKGGGKEDLAAKMAHLLNGKQDEGDDLWGDPVEVEAPLLAEQEGEYIRVVRPRSKSRKIAVDDIRALEKMMNQSSPEGTWKIGVIVDADRMGDSAANAFLKTLEEPPPHAIFILATTEKHKIIPTILSRCQVYDFHRISIPNMVVHLEKIAEKEGFKTEALPSIWENKDEFNALMQKASDDMIKLAKAIDTAEDLRAVQKDLMWNNCSACHNRFRAEH